MPKVSLRLLDCLSASYAKHVCQEGHADNYNYSSHLAFIQSNVHMRPLNYLHKLHHRSEAATLSQASKLLAKTHLTSPQYWQLTSQGSKHKQGIMRWVRCTIAVARYLAKVALPVNTVEKVSFNVLCSMFWAV